MKPLPSSEDSASRRFGARRRAAGDLSQSLSLFLNRHGSFEICNTTLVHLSSGSKQFEPLSISRPRLESPLRCSSFYHLVPHVSYCVSASRSCTATFQASHTFLHLCTHLITSPAVAHTREKSSTCPRPPSALHWKQRGSSGRWRRMGRERLHAPQASQAPPEEEQKGASREEQDELASAGGDAALLLRESWAVILWCMWIEWVHRGLCCSLGTGGPSARSARAAER